MERPSILPDMRQRLAIFPVVTMIGIITRPLWMLGQDGIRQDGSFENRTAIAEAR